MLRHGRPSRHRAVEGVVGIGLILAGAPGRVEAGSVRVGAVHRRLPADQVARLSVAPGERGGWIIELPPRSSARLVVSAPDFPPRVLLQPGAASAVSAAPLNPLGGDSLLAVLPGGKNLRWRITLTAPDAADSVHYETIWRAEPASAADSADWRLCATAASLERAVAHGPTRSAERAHREVARLERERWLDDPRRLSAALTALVLTMIDSKHLLETDAALPYLEEALELRRRVDGPQSALVAEGLTLLSGYFWRRENFARSAALEDSALAMRERLPTTTEEELALARRELGVTTFAVGDYAKAIGLLEQSHQYWVRQAHPDTSELIDLAGNLGEANRHLGHYAECERWHRRSLDLSRAQARPAASGGADPPPLFIPLVNLAGALYDQEDFSSAAPLYQEGLSLISGRQDGWSESLIRRSLGLIALRQGRLEAAGQYLSTAYELARRSKDENSRDFAFVWTDLAQYREAIGQLAPAEEALARAERCLVAAGDAGTRDLDYVLVRRGDLQSRLGQARQALDTYRRALAVEDRFQLDQTGERAHCLIGVARELQALGAGTPDSLLELLGRARQILAGGSFFADDQIEALALTSRIELARQRINAGREALRQAISLIENRRRLHSYDSWSRARYLGRYWPLYQTAMRQALQAGHDDEAFDLLERGRGQALLEQIEAAHVDPFAGVVDSTRVALQQRQRAARSGYTEFRARLEQLRQEATSPRESAAERVHCAEAQLDSAFQRVLDAEAEVRAHSPGWRRILHDQVRTLTWSCLRDTLLRPGDIYLSYQIGDSSSTLLVGRSGRAELRCVDLHVGGGEATALGVTPGALTTAKLNAALYGPTPGRPAAGGGVLGGLRLWSGARERRAAEVLLALGRILLPDSIRLELLEASLAIVVPDAGLFDLPFQALGLRMAGPDSTRDWLGCGPPILYASSASLLAQSLVRPGPEFATDGRDSILCLADPDFTTPAAASGRIPSGRRGPRGPAAGAVDDPGAGPAPAGPARTPLTASAAEVTALRTAFPTHPLTTLTGARATERAWRAAAPSARLLHLATHGMVVRRGSQIQASLALAPPARATNSPDDDGFLDLSEIYGMALDADLVVLSACETQSGPFVRGEGIFTLARGFLAAGARRVVGTLWEVPDMSTARFMAAFYAELAGRSAEEDLSRHSARAVQSAMRTLRRNPRWFSPYYWAPFALSGVR